MDIHNPYLLRNLAIAVAVFCILLNVRTRQSRAKRVGFLGFALMAAFYAAPRTERSDYRIGTTAIVYNTLANSYLKEGESIQVLDTSFEEGRGIVFVGDESTNVLKLLVSDVWEARLEYELTKTGKTFTHDAPRQQPAEEVICPAGECQPTEHGGFVTNAAPHEIVFCESHARRLLTWSVSPAAKGPDGSSAARVETRVDGIPLDAVAVSDGTIAVALSGEGDPSAAGQPAKPGRLVVYRGGAEISRETNVAHPVGLAFSQDRLYVADVTSGQLVWAYFPYAIAEKKFGPKAVIWAVRLPVGGGLPALHHMVIGSAGGTQAVFAGGPDGLYMFGRDGGLLAKYYVGAPVSGLTWVGKDQLFMTIGRRLAHLQTQPVEAGPEFRLLDDNGNLRNPEAKSPAPASPGG